MSRITYRCGVCCSSNIGHDAFSVWDDDTQTWVLGGTMDQVWCADCGEDGVLMVHEIDAEGNLLDDGVEA